MDPLPKSASFVFPQANAHISLKNIPPAVAARNIPGPLLFKCCRVECHKKASRLEIAKGEYIGKTVYKTRATDPAPKEEDGDSVRGYDDTIVNWNLDETDSIGKSNRCRNVSFN